MSTWKPRTRRCDASGTERRCCDRRRRTIRIGNRTRNRPDRAIAKANGCETCGTGDPKAQPARQASGERLTRTARTSPMRPVRPTRFRFDQYPRASCELLQWRVDDAIRQIRIRKRIFDRCADNSPRRLLDGRNLDCLQNRQATSPAVIAPRDGRESDVSAPSRVRRMRARRRTARLFRTRGRSARRGLAERKHRRDPATLAAQNIGEDLGSTPSGRSVGECARSARNISKVLNSRGSSIFPLPGGRKTEKIDAPNRSRRARSGDAASSG